MILIAVMPATAKSEARTIETPLAPVREVPVEETTPGEITEYPVAVHPLDSPNTPTTQQPRPVPRVVIPLLGGG